VKLLISAGEASSDLYGAQLIEALRRHDPSLEFMGVGGEHMRAAGCEIVVEAQHLAVVGMTEILSRLPRIYAEFRKLLRAVDATRPQLAVVIDSPAFNFRVARQLHRRGVPVIYFVAPQLWAWREYRVKRVQRWIKKVLCIFPFEVEFYRRYGVDVEYVGHPLADLPLPSISRQQFAALNGLDAANTWVALLPGSRVQELKQHLPTLVEVAAKLRQTSEPLEFPVPVASALDRGFVAQQLTAALAKASPKIEPTIRLTADARTTLLHSRAAVIASGTATVEAALTATPFVAVYRLSGLTYRLARKLVKVPYAAMPNLIVGEQVVPEFLQQDFTADKVCSYLSTILADGPARAKMLKGLEKVRAALHHKAAHQQPAIERAAAAIMATLGPGNVAPKVVQQHLL